MGLNEKRALQTYQEKNFPGIQKELSKAAKFDLKVEVNWEEIIKECGPDNMARILDESFHAIRDALASITADKMGADSLKSAMKKLVVCNSGARVASFEGGVLKVDHQPISNVGFGHARTAEIQKLLENSL